MNSNTDFYEAFASSYEAHYADVDASEAVRQWLGFLELEKLIPPLKSRLERPLSLLDIGCGPGWHLRPWKQAGFQATGLDASPTMLRIAAKNATVEAETGIPLYCANIQDIKSLKPLFEQFDLATAHFNFLNLFSSEQLPSVFAGVAALIKRDGLWITDLTSWAEKGLDTASQLEQEKHSRWRRTQKSGMDCQRIFWEKDKQQFEETYWFHSFSNLAAVSKAAGLNVLNCTSWHPAEATLKISKADGSSRNLLVFMRSSK